MPRRVRVVVVAAVAMVALTMVVSHVLVSAPPAARSLPPNPNGYDDFMKAAVAVRGDPANASALNHDGLAALVATNAEALRLTRLGLSRECRAPMGSALTNVSGLLTDLSRLKSLARLLWAKGQLAQMEGRYGEAAHSYVETIQFGNEISRGGFLITRLVGIACEAIGCSSLEGLVPKLSCAADRQIVAELQRLDTGRVTWAEVLRNEREFTRHQLGRNRMNPVLLLIAWWQTRQTKAKSEVRHKSIIARERLLMIELALRCYQSEHGHAPVQLVDLVPNYLSKVPEDPFTGTLMPYKPRSTN